jgi:translation initiation factor 3 subunit G
MMQCDQITRRIKRTLQKSVVAHAVAERQKWPKFGLEKGSKPGPDRATTTVGENVTLKLSVGHKVRIFFFFFFFFKKKNHSYLFIERYRKLNNLLKTEQRTGLKYLVLLSLADSVKGGITLPNVHTKIL